jgi:hypothetical protein
MIWLLYYWGGCLAMILSWSVNHSVLWCIVHAPCSWFYVLFFELSRVLR